MGTGRRPPRRGAGTLATGLRLVNAAWLGGEYDFRPLNSHAVKLARVPCAMPGDFLYSIQAGPLVAAPLWQPTLAKAAGGLPIPALTRKRGTMIRKHYAVLALLLTVGVSAGAAEAATYTLDAAHSSVSFVARHMVVSKVRGHFDTFEGNFDFTEGQPATWKAQATIQAASVNTGNEKRDGHLRSPDFFAAEEFPTLSFVSTGVEKKGETYLLKGDLTMRGVTKPIALTLEYFGSIKDPWGNDRAGFSARGTVNRKDFGLNWNDLIESGGAVVSDEIAIEIEVEGVHKP